MQQTTQIHTLIYCELYEYYIHILVYCLAASATVYLCVYAPIHNTYNILYSYASPTRTLYIIV